MSNDKGYISSIDDLQFWFEQTGGAQWILYRGFQDRGRMLDSTRIFKQENDSLSPEESYELLLKLIRMHSDQGAKFTLFVPGAAANRGSYVWIGINLRERASSLNGLPYEQGVVPAGEVERRISEALEKQDMRREIEDLKAAINGQMNPWQQLGQRFVEDVDVNKIVEGVQGILTGFIQGVAAHRVPTTLQGTPQDFAPQVEPGELDEQIIRPLLQSIRAEFQSEEAFHYFLRWITEQFLSNPGLYKQMAGIQDNKDETHASNLAAERADH